MHTTFLALLSLPLLALAHYTLDYPAARGFDEDKLTTFPCAGFPTSSNRSDWPLADGQIALTMGHDRSLVQVLLGIGNDVGEAFDYILLPTVQEEGLGPFCISGLQLPKGLNVTDGTNATIQVVTSGDPNGGLYNCADITFRNSVSPPSCSNNTGVRTTKNPTPFQNANQTNPGGSPSSSASATSSPSASSTAKSEAGQTVVGQWSLLLAAAIGAALLF